jgi:hypothetical protein
MKALLNLKYSSLVRIVVKSIFAMTFYGILSIPSTLFAESPLCSAVLSISEVSYKVLAAQNLAKTKIQFSDRTISKPLEIAVKELSELNGSERNYFKQELLSKKINADFFNGNEKNNSDLFNAEDFLLLALYNKSTWLKLLNIEFENALSVSPIWWNRGYLFTRMPKELLQDLQVFLNTTIKETAGTARAKKANRILTMLKIYLERPEIVFQNKVEARSELNLLLEDYFKTVAQQQSHYANSKSINAQEFGELTYNLNELFKSEEFKLNHPLVYWFGSIPNGRGSVNSDFDFASDANFSAQQEKLFKDFMNAKQKIVSIPADQESSVHSISFTIRNLFFLSPISIAFRSGRIFLVIREIITPDSVFISYNPAVTQFSEYKIRLWHYPVHVSADGKWSYDRTVPVWIED